MSEHRWSGWPGAWCLDCGIEDPNEVCIATHDDGLICECGQYMCGLVGQAGHKLNNCTEHVVGPCPEPGSRNHDPYTKKETP